MMLYATRKMYQVVSTEAYDNALKAFSAQLYAQKPASQNQVDFLLERFCTLPDIIEPERLKSFTRERTNKANRAVMTQQDFVHFLEHFYFLLTTEDGAFKTTPQQKLVIKQALRPVYTGQICEPGIVTRLNSIFYECRTDLQWIPNELLKQRLNKIQLMADQYNQEFRISAGYSVHTVNRMQQLAIEFELGVKLEVTIDDIYMHNHQIQGIDDYFKKHYIHHFKTYQTECIDGLTAHLWSVFTTQYRPRLKVAHGGRVQLTVENLAVLNEFLRTYLFEEDDLSPETFVYEDEGLETFVDEDEGLETFEDEDEVLDESTTFFLMLGGAIQQATRRFRSYIFVEDDLSPETFVDEDVVLDESNPYFLKPDDVLFQAIRNALIKKLQKDEFFISSEDLNLENSAKIYFLEHHYEKSQGFQAFLADFSNRTQFIEQISDNLLKHADVFLDHPEFIVDILSQNPSLWDSLPRQDRQNHQFIVLLIEILKTQADRSSTLNSQIYQKIILQNSEYSKYFDENHPIASSSRYVLAGTSIFQLQRIAHTITPWDFYGRSFPGLSPHAFGRFSNALTRLNLNWNANEYLIFKESLRQFEFASRERFLIDSKEYDQSLLLEALHMHNNWVDALIYFQQHLTVFDLGYCATFNFEHQLQLSWKAFSSWVNTQINILKLITLLVINIPVSLFWGVIQTLFSQNFQDFCRLILVFLGLVLLLNINLSPEDLFEINIYFNVCLWVSAIMNAPTFYIARLTSELCREIKNSFSLMWTMLAPLAVRGFLNLSQVFQAYTADQAIFDIENEILRLELLDTLSGLQKADILRQIWGHVLYDLNQNKNLSIQEALDKSHDFNFKGKNYQMSYQQVAAIKRQKHTELDLDAPSAQSYSWFSAKTEKVLRAIPANLSLAI